MSATIPTVQEASSLEGGSDPEIRRHSAWRVIAGNPLALAGMVVVAFWVLVAIFATRDRRSVLGQYSIDSGGDTTLDRYGADHVSQGRLVFWKALTAP